MLRANGNAALVQVDVFSLATGATALLLAAGLLVAYATNRRLTGFPWWAGSFVLLAIWLVTATLRLPPSAAWVKALSYASLYAAVSLIAWGLYRQGATRSPWLRLLVGAALLALVATALTLYRPPPYGWFLLGPLPTLVFVLWSALLVFRTGAWRSGLALLAGGVAIAMPSLTHPAALPALLGPPRALRGGFAPGATSGQPLALDPQRPIRGILDYASRQGPPPPIEHPLAVALAIIIALVALAVALILRDVMAEFDRMRRRSSTDAMTGLLNRVTFEETATALVAADTALPICAILFDIDTFKQVNDTAGHAAGDRVITRLGHLLQELAGPGSTAGRVGGEEFAVILAGADPAAARRFAESVRTRFSTADLGDDIGWRVTVSAGIAALRTGDTLHELMGRADKALYSAKAAGRDRVEMAGEPAAVHPWPTHGAGVGAVA